MTLILYHIIDSDVYDEDDDEMTEEFITLPEVRNFLYDFWWDDEHFFDAEKEKKSFLHEIKFTEDEERLNSMLEGIGYELITIEETDSNRIHFDRARKRLLEED